jgi:ASC-1-like (ASCH) protein
MSENKIINNSSDIKFISTNEDQIFYKKYLKYKKKYFKLQQQSGGSGDKLNSCQADWDVHVSLPWYIHIKEGRKTVEGRPKRNTFAQMKVGQFVKIFNKELNESFCVKITKITEHKTFEDMIRSNGIDNVLPGIRNIDEGIQVYMQYYNKEIESEFGVVGIHVSLI